LAFSTSSLFLLAHTDLILIRSVGPALTAGSGRSSYFAFRGSKWYARLVNGPDPGTDLNSAMRGISSPALFELRAHDVGLNPSRSSAHWI